MSQTNYVSYRNVTVASLSGRSVEFKKGIPTPCPPSMHAELLALGIVPEDPMEESAVDDGPKEPTVPTEREAALFAIFEKLTLRARREDFTAVGAPHAAVLAKELNWGQINSKERDAMWDKWKIAQTEAD